MSITHAAPGTPPRHPYHEPPFGIVPDPAPDRSLPVDLSGPDRLGTSAFGDTEVPR